jgi:opacity protein-like surface antigen
MKTKKLFLMAAVIAATAFSTVSAQRKKQAAPPVNFSVGLELGAPMGDAKNFYSVGFGGSGKIEIPATREFFITATAGFTSFYYKEGIRNALKAADQPTSQGFVPLKVGGKYYFSPAFYAEGEIGAAIGTNKGAETAFAYAPGIGVSIPLIGRNALDVGLRYEGWSQDYSFNQLGLRVAYKF